MRSTFVQDTLSTMSATTTESFVRVPTGEQQEDAEWASTHPIEQWLRPPRPVVLELRAQRRTDNHRRKVEAAARRKLKPLVASRD